MTATATADRSPVTTTDLDLEDVTLEIQGSLILNRVSLSVDNGQMLGVIGPNGAGKTTLFNVISGLIKPTSGSVHLAGVDVSTWPAQRRSRNGLGRTFQSSSLFDGLTVLENVRLAAQVPLGSPGSLVRFPRRHDRASSRAMELLEEMEIAELSARSAGDLAHGQKRKVEIAMALATEPSVVLLDEPMAGVAATDVPGVADVIARLHAGGRTILMVEHNMDVVLGLAERIAVLHHGDLLACDTPQRIMDNKTVQTAYLGDPL